MLHFIYVPAALLLGAYAGYRWGSAGVRRVEAELTVIEADAKHDGAKLREHAYHLVSRLRAVL